MEHLRCVVERITYQNADNGYTVLKCAMKNYSDLVTVVGTMPDTHVGSAAASKNDQSFWLTGKTAPDAPPSDSTQNWR